MNETLESIESNFHLRQKLPLGDVWVVMIHSFSDKALMAPHDNSFQCWTELTGSQLFYVIEIWLCLT